MKDQSAALRATSRLHISDEVVTSLTASTAAGNSGAKVLLKDISCPSCGQVSLNASARYRSATIVSYVRRRQFEVVTHCKASPCSFAGETSGKFSVTG